MPVTRCMSGSVWEQVGQVYKTPTFKLLNEVKGIIKEYPLFEQQIYVFEKVNMTLLALCRRPMTICIAAHGTQWPYLPFFARHANYLYGNRPCIEDFESPSCDRMPRYLLHSFSNWTGKVCESVLNGASKRVYFNKLSITCVYIDFITDVPYKPIVTRIIITFSILFHVVIIIIISLCNIL